MVSVKTARIPAELLRNLVVRNSKPEVNSTSVIRHARMRQPRGHRRARREGAKGGSRTATCRCAGPCGRQQGSCARGATDDACVLIVHVDFLLLFLMIIPGSDDSTTYAGLRVRTGRVVRSSRLNTLRPVRSIAWSLSAT